tara:strand:+ start:4546 stop:4716 length:171 start_codon:yes stop_codon:yes gene_type:complete
MGCIFSFINLKKEKYLDYEEPLLKKERSFSSTDSELSPPSYYETILYNKFNKFNND